MESTASVTVNIRFSPVLCLTVATAYHGGARCQEKTFARMVASMRYSGVKKKIRRPYGEPDACKHFLDTAYGVATAVSSYGAPIRKPAVAGFLW
jgi:hypothetical protein